MSNLVFPDLPGMTIKVKRAPVWRNEIARSASGRRQAVGFSAYPDRWRFELEFEFLRSGAEAELQALVGFFNKMRGNFDTFLWLDPDDNVVTNQLLGTGDGSRTSWPLVRDFGGFVEPVTEPLADVVYVNGVRRWRGTKPFINYVSRVSEWTHYNATSFSVVDPVGYNQGGAFANFNGGGLFGAHVSLPVALPAGQSFNISFDASKVASASSAVISLDLQPGTLPVVGSVTIPASGAAARYSLNFSGGSHADLSAAMLRMYSTPADFIFVWDAVLSVGSSDPGWMPRDDEYTLSGGAVSLPYTPSSGIEVRWSGTFRKRCAFVASELETERFLYQLYKCGKVELQTEKA